MFLRRDKDDAVRIPGLQDANALALLTTSRSHGPEEIMRRPARRTLLVLHVSCQWWGAICCSCF